MLDTKKNHTRISHKILISPGNMKKSSGKERQTGEVEREKKRGRRHEWKMCMYTLGPHELHLAVVVV